MQIQLAQGIFTYNEFVGMRIEPASRRNRGGNTARISSGEKGAKCTAISKLSLESEGYAEFS